MTGNVFFSVLMLCVVPYTIAVVMPTWRWLLGVTLVIGGAIAALWIQDWYITSNPDYHEGVGGALGRAMFTLVTLGFVTGVAVRAVTLFMVSRGLSSGYSFTICVLGGAIVPGFMASATAWDTWRLRPPDEVCLKATFHIKVANADFAIPALSFAGVYLGNRSHQDAYYFA